MSRSKDIALTTKRFIRKANRKAMSTLLALAILAVLTPVAIIIINNVHASGDATFSLSPSSGSYTVGNTLVVSVSETSSSGDNTNAVQANLSYSTSLLQYDSTSLNGPFTLCAQNRGGGGTVNIGCASSTAENGSQAVAQVIFTVLTSSSDAMVSMTSGSDIANANGSVLSSQTLPIANYTLNAASTPPSSPPPTSGSSSSNKSSGSSNSSTKSSSTHTPTIPTTTPAPATTGNATAAPSLGSISISVTNNQNKPILGAKVGLDNKQFLYTNTNGVANFTAVSNGKHSVTITDPGKKTIESEITLQPGENKLVDLKLVSNNTVSKIVTTLVVIVVILIVIAVVGYGYLSIRRKHLNNKQSVLPAGTSVTVSDARGIVKSNNDNIAPTITSLQDSQAPPVNHDHDNDDDPQKPIVHIG